MQNGIANGVEPPVELARLMRHARPQPDHTDRTLQRLFERDFHGNLEGPAEEEPSDPPTEDITNIGFISMVRHGGSYGICTDYIPRNVFTGPMPRRAIELCMAQVVLCGPAFGSRAYNDLVCRYSGMWYRRWHGFRCYGNAFYNMRPFHDGKNFVFFGAFCYDPKLPPLPSPEDILKDVR
jgi:hypothetical protein